MYTNHKSLWLSLCTTTIDVMAMIMHNMFTGSGTHPPNKQEVLTIKEKKLLKTKKIPVRTVATLVMACIAIEDMLTAGELTPDIADELQTIWPELERFIESGSKQ